MSKIAFMYSVKILILAVIQFNRHGLSKSLNLTIPSKITEPLLKNRYRHWLMTDLTIFLGSHLISL